jgi:redox-sensitive bicupin YhaK (pirin superfamily)
MSSPAIVQIQPLGFPWETIDPFLFCVYHDDAYPAGNAQFGPRASLAGRDLGQDFAGKDGWRMYHGTTVPGFPSHPHRGFETVTIVRKGLIDHSDSLGATARFGGGDVQWLTAGRLASVTPPLAPPPDSWAAQPESDLAIWTINMEPGARWLLPAAVGEGTRRTLYFFKGESVRVDTEPLSRHAAIELRAGHALELINVGVSAAEFLLLQGRPIGEPVAQHGPFVMNTREELQQAYTDYQRTGFGGWPWPDNAPVHGAAARRFARHADGRVETR